MNGLESDPVSPAVGIVNDGCLRRADAPFVVNFPCSDPAPKVNRYLVALLDIHRIL